jgi:ketosteroid isomerase-like protein
VTSFDPAAAHQLDNLRYGYAAALDRRDAEALRAVFHPDATIRIFPPGADAPAAETRGHDAIGMMTSAMADRFAATMHVISNPRSEIEGNSASGSAYCVAHHVILDSDSARSFVAYLRYDDTFGRQADGSWLIVNRDIRFLWCEEGNLPLGWEEATVRGRLA